MATLSTMIIFFASNFCYIPIMLLFFPKLVAKSAFYHINLLNSQLLTKLCRLSYCFMVLAFIKMRIALITVSFFIKCLLLIIYFVHFIFVSFQFLYFHYLFIYYLMFYFFPMSVILNYLILDPSYIFKFIKNFNSIVY